MSTSGDYTPWVLYAATSIMATSLYDFAKNPTAPQNHEAAVQLVEEHLDLYITAFDGLVPDSSSGGPGEEEFQTLVAFLNQIKDRLKAQDDTLRKRFS